MCAAPRPAPPDEPVRGAAVPAVGAVNPGDARPGDRVREVTGGATGRLRFTDPPQGWVGTAAAAWHTVSCVCRACLRADEVYIAPERLGWQPLWVEFIPEA